MSPLVKILGLELVYGPKGREQPGAGPLDLWIEEGETLGMVGESGSGKSTVAYELLGLLALKGGRKVRGETVSLIRHEEIAYIPQDPLAALDPLFSVESHLREAGLGGGSPEQVLGRVGLSLKNIGLKSYPHELSGGMRQRLVIAMALLRNPRMIIADEPTSSLDLISQAGIMSLFREISGRGMTFVFITHNLPLARQFCERIAVFRKGKVVQTGTFEEILTLPADDYVRNLIAAVPALERD